LTATRTTFASVLSMAEGALVPSPLLVEIEAEQSHLSALTKKAKPEDRLSLVIPQKNLIHAVDAVVASLDPLAHKIESGTVMIFAKDDMDAAAIGLETDDIEEALDAQLFVVESLQELRAKIDQATPEYRYVLEVTENLYEIVPQSARIRIGTRQLLEKAEGAPDAAAVKTQVKQFGEQVLRLTGEEGYAAAARQLDNAIGSGAAGAGAEDALDDLITDTEALQLLMDNLAYLMTPPPPGTDIKEPSTEVKLIYQAMAIAAPHMDLLRATQVAKPEELAGLAAQQRKLATQCAALPKPPASLVAAQRHLSEAAAKLQAGELAPAITRQTEAGDALRYFILEYVLKYVMIPPTGPPQPAAPTDDAPPEDAEERDTGIFLPGAITGTKPKGGRLEWEVLGRRDRAALNENFARELPLEYRAILKDYYERLTE
jgi:hypothetical protein